MPVTFPARLPLGRLDTPIEPLDKLSRWSGKNVHIWRDDLSGWELSGNKVRKLEYICAEALARGADHLVTCGGLQSNHARATAFAARKLGLGITLVVREPPGGQNPADIASGNLLLNQLLGANFVFVPFEEYVAAGSVYEPFLQRVSAQLDADGARPYMVPEGGSCARGCWGYLAAFRELTAYFDDRPFDVFCAVGSGGTLAGLELGRQVFAPQSRVRGVNICDTAEYFQDRVAALIGDFDAAFPGTGPGPFVTKLNVHDGFVGDGYSIASDEDLAFYAEFARDTGILLDPVYTGKAFRGMLQFLGERRDDLHDDVVFLHSGGQFATFAFANQYRRALTRGDINRFG